MAEPLRNFDEHESEPATIEPLPPALPETPAEELYDRPFVVEDEPRTATERVGSVVGEVMGSLQSRIRSGLSVVKGRSRDAGDAIGDAAESAQEKARELSEEARIRIDELRRNAYRRMRQARVAGRRAVDEYPLQSLVAIGGMALVLGFLLRIWRANGD